MGFWGVLVGGLWLVVGVCLGCVLLVDRLGVGVGLCLRFLCRSAFVGGGLHWVDYLRGWCGLSLYGGLGLMGSGCSGAVGSVWKYGFLICFGVDLMSCCVWCSACGVCGVA